MKLSSCFSQLALSNSLRSLRTLSRPLNFAAPLTSLTGNTPIVNHFHTSASFRQEEKKVHFLRYNEKVYPPTPVGEKQRPAYVCHMKKDIKYSPKKMWYVACLVRGMRIDDAINQLKFVHKKGATAVREALEEAQELAVKEHNVEFKSNLWVSESFCTKGTVIKGMRRHARRRFGVVKYKYVNYCVTLEEGDPPEHYYHFRKNRTGPEMLQEWMEGLRKRTIGSTI